MFSASIVGCDAAVRSCGRKLIDRYRQAKQAAARTVLEAKTSGLGGVRCWQEEARPWRRTIGRPRRDSNWQTVRRLRRGKQYSANTVYSAGGELLTSTGDIVEIGFVSSACSGKAPGVDEIRPEYLKSLDVVGLSWLTRLCNIAWRLGTVPLEWQTVVVVPLFKKGDQRVCSNYRGSHFSQPPQEGLRQGTGEENSADSR
ncbi:hypothetical protein L3Q82_011556 [Scortum barcoo]|uniref:Uncharacterized protein n=1 Tax=Scortum barcoo TaxID=214431 RepID=A0ACB8W7I8_9TELE|nr:hypothetical protein L3Q82_011556 [Scortum barcoo]